LIEIAVKPPMTPRQDLVHGSMAVAARINPRSLDRADVEIHVDRLLRQMDRRARLKTHADHQDVRLVVAHEAIGAIAGDGRIVDMMARSQQPGCRSEAGNRMGGMYAARVRVLRAKYLTEHAGM
jgi:tRNA A37 threonylcarbamoyladenosine dehydratase